MASQQQKIAMVLYIPYTYGDNDGRKGVTEEEVFLHMRNLKFGYIDHIDCKQHTGYVYRPRPTHMRSWFVYFSTWTASKEVTESLPVWSCEHEWVCRRGMGEYWKIFKYTPTHKQKAPTFSIVPKTPKTDEEEGGCFPAPDESVFDDYIPYC